MGSRGVAPLQAQSADDIVAKYVEALGGEDVLSSIQTIYLEGSMQVSGSDLPVRVFVVAGKGFRTEMEAMGSTTVLCITPQGGWMIKPLQGAVDAQAMPDEQVQAGQENLQIGGLLFNYSDKGNQVELMGKDGNAYHLRVIPKAGAERHYYIDANTYFLIRRVVRGTALGQVVEMTTTFSDYRKTDSGYVMAYSTELQEKEDQGDLSSVTTYNKVEINKPIDPAIFDMPK
jgi:hypothetical protein